MTIVRYHGTRTDQHGAYVLESLCSCDDCCREYEQWEAHGVEVGAPEPVRHVLASEDGTVRLSHVRAESFTPIQP